MLSPAHPENPLTKIANFRPLSANPRIVQWIVLPDTWSSANQSHLAALYQLSLAIPPWLRG